MSASSPDFTGLALKVSRVGSPRDLIVRIGSQEGAADIGEARIPVGQILPSFDLWYAARLKAVRLDSTKLYFFEVGLNATGDADGYYLLYGPRPLGGKDYPSDFGLSYQVLTEREPFPADGLEARFEFLRRNMNAYAGGPPVVLSGETVPQKDEITIDPRWSVYLEGGTTKDSVGETAVADLDQFLRNVMKVSIKPALVTKGPHIELRFLSSGVEGVNSTEGYRVEVEPGAVTVSGTTPRGVMRGVYWLEDSLRERHAPFLREGVIVRNCRLPRRITIAPGGGVSPANYTDGLLQRISHDGFNALWESLNTEEATLHSEIFPELDDPTAGARLKGIQELAGRAQRFGIDVYLDLSTGYKRHLPPSFFEKYPETKGVGWGPPMCTSNADVRRYYAETVQTIIHQAPLVKGLIVIYDSEGFWYCGNSDHNLKLCPRCSRRTQPEVAAEILKTLDDAMHGAGGPEKEFIAWNYNVRSAWVVDLFPLLPKKIIVQGDFDKGMIVDRDGIQSQTEDYSIASLGPPELFVKEYQAARAQGLTVMTKTEHAVSQESIFIPYIPCMEQWYARVAKIREFDLGGWLGNWDHYGYTPSRPAQLINRMSFDPAPSLEELLRDQAERDFGRAAAPYVLRAWHAYSKGIRAYPYSDPVARIPGPIEKGPSQPLFLDSHIPNFGRWRSWQNDLDWTKPWGVEIATKYLGHFEEDFAKGNAELRAARLVAPVAYRPAIESELNVALTIQTATRSVLNLAAWIQTREKFEAATSDQKRRAAAEELAAIALKERQNCLEILPVLDADSRLGYASGGGGIVRGGLFTPALVRWKLGVMDDMLLRQLPATFASQRTGGDNPNKR